MTWSFGRGENRRSRSRRGQKEETRTQESLTMEKTEKQQRFHEAVMKIYFPPEPNQTDRTKCNPEVSIQEDGKVAPRHECMDMHFIPDVDDLEKESSSDDMGEPVPQKLTRSQRKRLRRRKLKETASSRKKIIGPLLPPLRDGSLTGSFGVQKEHEDADTSSAVEAVSECLERKDGRTGPS